MGKTLTLKKKYLEEIIPALKKEFGYKSRMQVPKLQKIVINQGIGEAVADKKMVDIGVDEITAIAGQKASANQIQKKIYPISNSERICLLGLQ